MDKNICIKFLNHISNNIKDTDNPIIDHNKIYNKYWNNNKLNIECLIEKLFNQIRLIINSTNQQLQYNKHIKWDPIIHKYPICYLYYIESKSTSTSTSKSTSTSTSKSNINFETFNKKINKREIKLNNNINYKSYIQEYINSTIDNSIIDILNKLQNGIFISLDIKLYVENNINNCFIYMFEHLNLYIFNNDKIFDNTIRDKLVLNIYRITKWIYNLNPIKKITLYYLDTIIDKRIIKDINYLCSQNINSGLSTTEYIMIWRREEVLKVLIHELIHYLNIDLKHNTQLEKIIDYPIGIFNYPILINETITELQAQLFNILYILISDNINSPISDIIKLFKIFYNLEQIFSWYQFTKIMNYFSINSFDIESIKENFNQSTNVYSYFILKSILSMYFFDILYELDYIKKLIKQDIRDKYLMIDKVKNIIDNLPIVFLNKIIKNQHMNDDSLRMTIFGYF